MTKLGVGVGEEFPVDEKNRPASEPPPEDDGSHCCGHGAHAARREAWRRFRQQMHAEWHDRRRAFRDGLNRQDTVEIMEGLRARRVHHLVLGALALIGLAALFSHHRHD